MNGPISRLYARYAVALLALTLIAGVYLRAGFAWPSVRGGVSTSHMIHAHSHVGFFGWMVMAAAAALVQRVDTLTPGGRRLHVLLAHGIGVGSIAAFVGFALRGYDALTIAIAALHVAFWIGLAAALWRPLARVANGSVSLLLRGGLGFLVLAGAATLVPALMMARAVTDPWAVQLGVKLFLTPFVTGFLLLTALGLLATRFGPSRNTTTIVLLIAAGTLPSTLLYVPGAPSPYLVLLGRIGMGLVGAALALFAGDAVRAWLRGRREARAHRVAAGPTSLALLSIVSVALVGVLKLLASAGVGAAFMHNRTLVVAVLHLVLLGIVTPSLLLGLLPRLVAPVRTALYSAGLVLLLTPLVGLGWPWALRLLLLRGITIDGLLATSAIGGIVAAAALVALAAPVEWETSSQPAAREPARGACPVVQLRSAATEP